MSISLHKITRRIRKHLRHVSAMQIIAVVFLMIIVTGALLLALPASSRSGDGTPFLTALFTATSATCVTGLTLVDTCTHWSEFGQAVILLLIQVGGLGFMTIASMFFLLARRRIGLRQRLIIAQSMGLEQLSGLVKLVKHVLLGTLLIEGSGALILTIRFSRELPFGKALWWGVFHSVSAFCNAGFDIVGAVEAGGSLVPFVGDFTVNLTIMALITLGGLGFYVWEDMVRSRSFRKMSVHTRLVLLLSLSLAVGGGALFALLEWNNPATLGGMPAGEKLLAAMFQSVTTRTAGYYTVHQSGLTDASIALSDFLMLVGGSSGSTAGGVKTVTMGVLLLSVIAAARGRSRVTVFHRTISAQQVRDAVAVVTMVFLAAFGSAVYLSAANGVDFMDCMFETVSAIATVGLSTGITAGLNALSQVILIILMFFGRVGVMTISLGFLLSDQTEERFRYAETKVLIG